MARRRTGFVLALTAVFATVSVFSAQQLTQRDADSMAKKIAAIVTRGSSKPAAKPAALRTLLNEREVNAYLKFHGKDQLPAGVVDPSLTLAGDRRVSARAIVDLDMVRTAKERGWLDPAAYLTGSLEIRAAGLLQTANGKGTIQIESAHVGGVPIPKTLLQELVMFYSRSPDQPGGFDLDKPFDLPASIREVEIQRGAATIIQ